MKGIIEYINESSIDKSIKYLKKLDQKLYSSIENWMKQNDVNDFHVIGSTSLISELLKAYWGGDGKYKFEKCLNILSTNGELMDGTFPFIEKVGYVYYNDKMFAWVDSEDLKDSPEGFVIVKLK